MLHIIANPASQSGIGKQRIKDLIRQLEKENLSPTLHLTTHKGHAGELARKLQLTEEDQLVIVGGDGSINEMINGLELPYPASVILCPSGSGNDFARGMKISHDQKDLIRILKESAPDHTQKIDLGEVTSTSVDDSYFPPLQNHRFAVTCGFGMDAAICHNMEQGKLKSFFNRIHMGKLSYLIVGLQTLFATGRSKRPNLQIEADGKKLQIRQAVFVSVHNLPYEGGGFCFAPDASPEDGLLNVCIVHVPNRLLMIPLLIACLLGGKHTRFTWWVKTLRCRSLRVHADRPMPLHTDGEVISGQTGFTAKALNSVISYQR